MMSARREDLRFITGTGRYTSDIILPGMVHACFVRSPHSHARILSISPGEALHVPGFIAQFSAEDLAATGISYLPHEIPLKRRDGRNALAAARPALANDIVRYVGEPVAVVVAESQQAAIEAAEKVEIEYDDLSSVNSLEDGIRADLAVWDDAVDNVAAYWSGGDAAAVEKEFSVASFVVEHDFRISRVSATPMEPRSAVALPDANDGLHLLIGHQNPIQLRNILAEKVFRIPAEKIRVSVPDVGGSFGLRTGVHQEEVVVLWLARQLGRPVKWLETRSEALIADDQSRDVLLSASLALDSAGNFRGLKVRFHINIGGYVSGRSVASVNNVGGIAGVYRTPAIFAEVFAITSNTVPTGPYRGAGRPEATFAIERLIDIAAKATGIGAFELRRRNLIPSSAMPFKTGLTFTYDSGDFLTNMNRAAELAELYSFPERRRKAAQHGKLRGLGVANLIEAAGGPFGSPAADKAVVTVRSNGSIILTSGAISTGQGLETVLPAVIAERLGVDPARIEYVHGDSAHLDLGRGSGGSGGASVSGPTVSLAARRAIDEGRRIAAEHLEASESDIAFEAGNYVVAGTDSKVGLFEVASLFEKQFPGKHLSAVAENRPSGVTFPNGCHICEVEIDPETGAVKVIRYTAVEDIGTVLNRELAHGQMHGGIAQGISQAIGEAIIHDHISGQVLSGSFMDYGLIKADEMPEIVTEMNIVPTTVNPLGAKGVGEAGTVGALVTTVNAICDALSPLGIDHIDMPASPDHIWKAIQQASRLDAKDNT